MVLKVICFTVLFCAVFIHAQKTETVKDADGNVYTTVQIGNQIWTVENWRSTKYNNGSPIAHVTGKEEWKNLTTGAYCYYDNNLTNKAKYGALYNWYAVNTGKIAPKGWRVATDADWIKLEEYLIANGYNWDGWKEGNMIAKALAAKTDWKIDTIAGVPGNNPESNNKSGFSALPGGYRNGDGGFYYVGTSGRWWSATEYDASYAYFRGLGYCNEGLGRNYYYDESLGFSVRLLRDFN